MAKRVKPPAELPAELWVQAYHSHNTVGSIAHVSYGEKFFRTKEDCQRDIDNMKSWLGMGGREKYRPLKLVNGELTSR